MPRRALAMRRSSSAPDRPMWLRSFIASHYSDVFDFWQDVFSNPWCNILKRRTVSAAAMALAVQRSQSFAWSTAYAPLNPTSVSVGGSRESGETTGHGPLHRLGRERLARLRLARRRRARAYRASCSRHGSRLHRLDRALRRRPRPRGKPLGTDFVSFWTASHLALDGRPDLAYDVGAHWAAQKALFGPSSAMPRSSIRRPLLDLPAAGARALLLVARGLAGGDRLRLLSRRARLSAFTRSGAFLAFPAVLVNTGHGQNGFLSAALIGGGASRWTGGRRSPAFFSARWSSSRIWRWSSRSRWSRRGDGRRSPSPRRPRPLSRLRRSRRSARRYGAAFSPRPRSPARRSSTISSATRKCRASSPASGCCMAAHPRLGRADRDGALRRRGALLASAARLPEPAEAPAIVPPACWRAPSCSTTI